MQAQCRGILFVEKQTVVGIQVECLRCGTCCVAPDNKWLDKALGVRCPHLGEDNACTGYERRPEVCRRYRPDEICRQIAAPTLTERVNNYLQLFGMSASG